jgi:hypothetical protein
MHRALSGLVASLVVSAPALALAQGYGQSPYGQGSSPYGQQGGGTAAQPYGGSGSQGQPAYGSQPANQPSSLQAGGLTAPGTSQPEQQPDPASQQTERELEKAEEEDSGRGLEWFYINAEGGVEHVGLQTFSANNLIDASIVESTQTGWVVGAGLGLRLLFITIGPRFRLGTFSAWQLWTLNGEVGFHIPLGSIEPYFVLGAGYASVGSFGADNIGSGLNSSDVSITGYDIRGGGGLDIYVTPVFSIGANVTFEMLGLTRPGVTVQQVASGPSNAQDVYALDGSSTGSALTGTLVLGLHF